MTRRCVLCITILLLLSIFIIILHFLLLFPPFENNKNKGRKWKTVYFSMVNVVVHFIKLYRNWLKLEYFTFVGRSFHHGALVNIYPTGIELNNWNSNFHVVLTTHVRHLSNFPKLILWLKIPLEYYLKTCQNPRKPQNSIKIHLFNFLLKK